jgi:glycosyltransferase involved in cell wall biosynthesis
MVAPLIKKLHVQQQQVMDTISVIIPNFNRANLIGETLENILNQTLPPHEIIVVDDGSTDNIAPIIAKYQDRVIFTKNQRGKGPGGARNTGLDIATGNYIKFFDSDDVMTLNSLEIQLKRLKESNLPIIYSPYVHAAKENEVWKQLDPIVGFDAIVDQTIVDCMVQGFFQPIPTMLIQKDWLLEIGHWREGVIAEDYDLLFRFGQSVPQFAHTNECCTFYRMHGAQSMGTNISNVDRDLEKCDVFWELLTTYKPGVALYSDKNEAYFRVLWSNTVMSLPPDKRKYYRATIGDRIYRIFHRLEQKLGRIISGTAWQPYHGPNANPETFEAFTQNIYLTQ